MKQSHMKRSYMKNSNVKHSIRKVVRHQFGHKTRTQTFHAASCEFRTQGCYTKDIRTPESGPFSIVSPDCRQKMNFHRKRARMADDRTLNREIFSNDSVFVYQIPLNKKSSKKARKWNLKEPIWCGCLKIFAVGNSCLLKFGDGEDFYGESLVGRFPDDNLFPVADSTRYYFVRIEFSDDNNDLVGIGFSDRVDSGNFCDALLNFFQSPFAIIHESIKQSKAYSKSKKRAIHVPSNLESRFEKESIISNETETCDTSNSLPPSPIRRGECNLTSNLMPSALACGSTSKAAGLSNENEALFPPVKSLQGEKKLVTHPKTEPCQAVDDLQLEIQSKSKATGLSNENEACFAPVESLQGGENMTHLKTEPCQAVDDFQLEIQAKSTTELSNENEACFAPVESLQGGDNMTHLKTEPCQAVDDCELEIQAKSTTELSNENEFFIAPVESLQGGEIMTHLKTEPCQAVDDCMLEIQSASNNNHIEVESGRAIPTKNIAFANLTSVASGVPSIFSSSLADRPIQSSLLPYGFSVNVSKGLNADDSSSSNSCYESDCLPGLSISPRGSNIQRNSEPGFSYSGEVARANKPVISHMQPRKIEILETKRDAPRHFGSRRNSRFKLTNVYGINVSFFNANPKLDVSVDIMSHPSKQTQIHPSKSRCQSGKLNEVSVPVPGEMYCCACQHFHVQYDCNHPEMSYGFPSRSKSLKW